MSGVHGRLSFSGAPIWAECPGSIQLSAGRPPEPDTEETLEGNAADWLAKEYAAGREHPYGTPIPLPGDFRADYDMIHGAKLWAATIGSQAVWGLPVSCTYIHPTDAWGEDDAHYWDEANDTFYQWDYKFGWKPIHPRSWQLIGYAGANLEQLDKLGSLDTKVVLGIVQPRAWHADGPVRTWKTDVGTLRGYLKAMQQAAQLADAPQPPVQTGPHCTHCLARGNCTTLQRAAMHAADFAGNATRANIPPEQIGTHLAILRAAKERLDAAESGIATQVEALMRQGISVPPFRFETTPGKLAWNEGVTVDDVIGLGQMCDPPRDMHKPPTLSQAIVTPTQAKNAGIPEAMVDALATRKNVTKMVEDTGAAERARRVFG